MSNALVHSRAVDRSIRVHRAQPPAGDDSRPRRGWLRRPVVVVGMALLMALFFGYARHPRAFVAATSLSLVLGLGVLVPWVSLRRLRAEVATLRRRARVGEPLTLRVTLQNGWLWPVFGLRVRCGWALQPRDDPATLSVARVPALRGLTIEWEMTPPRRGIFPVAPVRVECGFPFGLITAVRRCPAAREVIVWPAAVRLPRLALLGREEGATELTDERRSGSAGEITGARLYRPGESLRRVHWPQTARHGYLIVCERSAMIGRGVQVVIETAGEVHEEPSGGATLETAMRIAASVAAVCAEHGSEISLLFQRDRLHRAENRSALVGLLDGLAAFDLRDGVTLEHLFELPECRDFDGVLQLVVTTARGYARVEAERRRGFARQWIILGAPGDAPVSGRGVGFIPADASLDEILPKLWQEVDDGR